MFNTDKPVYKVPYTKTDCLVEALSVAAILLTWIYVVWSYNSLPNQIPSHYDLSGNVDTISHKSSIWIMPILSALLYFFLTMLNNFPHLFNYLEEITPENIQQQYSMGTRMIRYLKFGMVCLFLIITFATIDVANRSKLLLATHIITGLFVIVPVVVFIKSKKRSKA